MSDKEAEDEPTPVKEPEPVEDEAPEPELDEEPKSEDKDGNEYEEGLIKGKKPKGTRRYVWMGHPAKLHIKEITHPETGHLKLRKGDLVDLIPRLQRQHAHYIKQGYLVPTSKMRQAGGNIDNLPNPPRRSPHTDKKYPERQ